MSRITLILIIFGLMAASVHAGPAVDGRSAEVAGLQDRIDQREKQIATMTGYGARLTRILATHGIVAEPSPLKLSPARKLARMLPGIHCDNVRLVSALSGLSRVAEMEIHVDWALLADVGVNQNTRVTCDEQACSVHQALQIILTAGSNDNAIGWLLERDVIVVTTRERLANNVVTKTYDLASLLPRNLPVQEAGDTLCRIVTDTVAPESWRDAGGISGMIRLERSYMVITQTPENLDQIERLFEEFDIDKKLARCRDTIETQESQIGALAVETENLKGQCRSAGIRVPPRLDEAMSALRPDADFIGTPLARCFDSLTIASGQPISVNWKALEAVGISGETPITLTLRRQTLAAALAAVTDKAGDNQPMLAYVTQYNSIIVSTREDLHQAPVTRVYDVRDLIQWGYRGQTRQEIVDLLVARLEQTIAPESWRDAGGTEGSIRELQGQLIITQSEAVQATIKALRRRNLQRTRER